MEQGTHQALMQKGELYCQMVGNQNMQAAMPHALESDKTLTKQEALPKVVTMEVSSDFGHESGSQPDSKPSAAVSIWSLALFVFRLNSKDLPLILCGLGFSIMAGASFPT